jgi:RHS repeat-associated protein
MMTWQDFGGGAGTATTTWNYDPYRGWLQNKRYPDNKGPDYTYTPGGRLKTRTWARNHSGGSPIVTTYNYGFDDAPTSNQYPDVVEVSYNDGVTPKLTTGYDRLGRVESLALGEGATNILAKQLHPSGTLLSESYSGGPMAGFNLIMTLDAVLRRQTLAARNGTNGLGQSLTFGYDEGGRLQHVSDGTYSARYDYLAHSPLWQTLTFKQNSTPRATTTRQFDFLDRLQSISTAPAGASANPLAFAYAYNLANQRVRRTDPDTGYWVYEYDDLGQVISGRKHWSDGTPVAGQQFEYAYDDIGNRTATAEGGNEDGNSLRSASYTANSLNQYSSRTVPSSVDVLGVGTPAATITVNAGATYRKGEYFRAQLVITNASGPIATPVTVNANSGATNTTTTGQVLTPPVNQNFEYDLDGNLINDLVWSYTWDGENRLLAMEALATVADSARAKVSWEYDPAGRRIRQTVATNWTGSAYSVTNETRMLYDGWACIAELNSAGTLQRQYAWGLDLSGTTTGAGGVGGYLWMRPSGGAAHFAAHDGNGNVAALVDGSSGMVSARYDYEPFGRTLRLTGTGTIAKDNPFRFSSKRAEDTTAIILYEYRPYSPSLSRWPTRDPLEERGDANLYTFSLNRPASTIDALGRSPIVATGPNYSQLLTGAQTGPTIPAPAFVLSVLDNSGFQIPDLHELPFFEKDPSASKAMSVAVDFFLKELRNRKSEICSGQKVRLPSFYSGSGDTGPADEALRRGLPIQDYPIPQGSFESIAVMGGIEWRPRGLAVKRVCCEQTFTLTIAVVDKLGWESDKYGPWPFMEKIAGTSREIERARFGITGRFTCCE